MAQPSQIEERRAEMASDRRAHPRGGRRDTDVRKPWYMRRRLWLALVSLAYVGWHRLASKSRPEGRPLL